MKILFNKAKNDQWDESEVAMAVIARFGTGGNNMPIVVDDESICDVTIRRVQGVGKSFINEAKRL